MELPFSVAPEYSEGKIFVLIPLWLAVLISGNRQRLVIFPPQILIKKSGHLKKFPGHLPLSPMSGALERRLRNSLSQFSTIDQPLFLEKLKDKFEGGNILEDKNLNLNIQNGLKELREQDWVKNSDFENIIKILGKYLKTVE
jgi:hypothetical protein